MNPRTCYLETVLFGHPERIPLQPGGGRESTRARWHREGLPEAVTDITDYAYRLAGGKLKLPKGGEWFTVSERMIPMFEEKVLERKANSQIVQDWKGNVCEIGLEFTVDYLRNPRDFVTRRWIKCPVENQADWEAMKQRYNPDDPARYSTAPELLGRRLADRDYPIGINFSGPFWQLREWLGFEQLCILFHDDPEFVREMIAFWDDYVARLLLNTYKYVVPDEVHLSEDMAYKEHSMISPAMTREFLLPVYRHWGQIIRDHGGQVYAMDSDGNVEELIPIWIEAGINLCDPLEVAAGNDIIRFRQQFGRAMAYRGGVDKRCIAKGGAVLEAEIQRLLPLIRDGGYIPACDHGVPADVSWPNYVQYVGLLAKATGWL